MIYLRMQVKFITMYKCDVFAMFFLLLLLYLSLLSKYYAITLQATTTEQQQVEQQQQQRTRTHRLCTATRQAGNQAELLVRPDRIGVL